MSGDISLRLRKNYETPFHVGREAELDDLKSYLRNSNGGTVLLGGLRGSGKTKLLDALQEELKGDKDHKFLFIDVVLHDDIEPEELRTVLLKSITYSLYELENTLPWWKANNISLFKRYLMPWLRRDFLRRPKISRRRFYKRLIKVADYTTVSEIVGKEASFLAKFKQLEASAKQAHSLKGEVDLSSARLEQMLRNYFEAACRLGVKVVFIFDELDKLYGRSQSPIDAQAIARKFKNLLTRNGTYAIFVTSESELRSLKADISSNPYQITHTLFSKTLLLNQLNPEDFRGVITRFFTPAALKHEQIDMICDYLMWESGLHLFTLGQVIDQHKVITNKGVHHLVVDGVAINYDASYQYFLNLVYADHKSKRSDFYNRVLYLSLRMVLQRLSSGKQLYFDSNNFLTLLAVGDDFASPSDPDGSVGFKSFLGVTSHPQTFSGLFTGDDWRQELALLKPGELLMLNNALRDLVWQLDRAQLVLADHGPNLSPAASEVRKQTLDFLGDGLGYANCRRLEPAVKQTLLEKELRQAAARVRLLTERLGIDTEGHNVMLMQYGGAETTITASDPKSHYYRPFSWEIKVAGEALEKLEQTLPGQLFDRFANAVIDKMGGEFTEDRSLPIVQIIRAQLGLPHKTLSVPTDNGGLLIHFVAGATPEQQTRIFGYLQSPHMVINLLHGLSGDQHEKHDSWRNVAIRPDYDNFKQNVYATVRRLKRL